MLGTFLRRLVGRGGPNLLPVGAAAPDFEATDQNGNTVTRAQLEGRRFVLWFYPMADTPG